MCSIRYGKNRRRDARSLASTLNETFSTDNCVSVGCCSLVRSLIILRSDDNAKCDSRTTEAIASANIVSKNVTHDASDNKQQRKANVYLTMIIYVNRIVYNHSYYVESHFDWLCRRRSTVLNDIKI